jgi:HEAT repeat protein
MEKYEPTSEFLKVLAAGDAALSGNEFADSNLEQLVAMLGDGNRSNRDWATFLLSMEEIDTPAVRAALLNAASDDDEFVRAEAIWGLARRNQAIALPLIQEALSAETVALPIFEAAALVAERALAEALRRWTRPSGNPTADRLVAEALVACESGAP